MNAAEIARTIRNRYVTYTEISTGASETVYYGARRIGSDGRPTEYEIGDSAILETSGGQMRGVSFYRSKGVGYACLDFDCPYVFTSQASRPHPTPGSPRSAK